MTEAGRTAYLTCAAAALAAELDLSTGIAVAFPRSPMVTAGIAWELAEVSGGPLPSGSGHPGAGPHRAALLVRVRSARATAAASTSRRSAPCFRAFRGEEKLDFQGEYWSFSLLPAMWSPGALSVPDPPIDIAAVNPWMLRMAGEVADGVHVHPMNHPAYLARDGADRTLPKVPRRRDGTRPRCS